jgi:myo-inositol-1(or 4)-monophosphatase
MSDPEIQSRHDLSLRVAAEAGRLAHTYWINRGSLAVEAKSGAQDLVSEADRAVERMLREAVSRAHPEDGFLGEEYGFTAGRSGFVWVFDPIDGTAPFLHGLPHWCVAIALLRGNECVAAVTEVPTNGEVFSGMLGKGTKVNGNQIMIPTDLTLANGITGVGASAFSDPDYTGRMVRDLLARGGMFLRNGSGALMLAYVAAGRLTGYSEPVMYPWDCLGGLLMIREAGGRSLPLRHTPAEAARERVIAGAPGAWEDLQALFGA